MPTPTTAKTFRSAAAERADYYATHFGSAAAALAVVDQPGHNDTFDREVMQELRSLAADEAVAARGGRTWADCFLEQIAASEAAPEQRWAA